MKSNMYIIQEVFNHNALLCQQQTTDENYLFFGKGIGFKRKRGDIFVVDKNVERVLLTLTRDDIDRYKFLVQQVENKQLIKIVQNIVLQVQSYFEHTISGDLEISLLDHLNFAIQRRKQGYDMHYPFVNELKFLYPKEYTFSQEALAYLKSELKDDAPDDDELAFLIMHIHAAVSGNRVSNVLNYNHAAVRCVELLEQMEHIKIDRSTVYYSRFLRHVIFALQRSRDGQTIKNVMLDNIKKSFSHEFELGQALALYVKKTLRLTLDEDEIAYLALHIYSMLHDK